MPYIKPEERQEIDAAIRTLADIVVDPFIDSPTDAVGRLNYSISRLIDRTLGLVSLPHYAKFNAAIGVLECVKLELYRRLAAPYEDKKLAENGDVF